MVTIVLRRGLAVLGLIIGLVVAPPGALAQGSIKLVRDAETEALLRKISDPLFDAAGVAPSSVQIFLVNDEALNAFVAGGQNMFVNLGLLTHAETVEEVIGVVAHETGHISGGHLVRGQEALRNAYTQTLLGAVLGVGAGLLTGRGDVGAAVIAGTSTTGARSFLSFSRTQESAADRTAFRLLEATGQSARGLRAVMKKIEGQSALNSARQDPYMQTHPLSDERIDAIENHMASSRYTDADPPASVQTSFQRVRAKVLGYTKGWIHTLNVYPEADTSAPARYARAYAAWRRPNIKQAIAEMDTLIAEFPQDPYFNEFLGQLRFEAGDPEGARDAYAVAVAGLPDSPLILTEFARVKIEIGGEDNLRDAVDHLRVALRTQRKNPGTWRQLGIAYSRLGDDANASLALAEESALRNDWPLARHSAEKAATLFKEGTPGWLQAQDILGAADRAQDREPDDTKKD